MPKVVQFNEEDIVFCQKPTRKEFKDLDGMRFYRLSVMGYAGVSGTPSYSLWYCKCDCGVITKVRASSLLCSKTFSCGCKRIEVASITGVRHGHAKHGDKKNATYVAWSAMLTRCYNKKCQSYQRYGGRGISVTERWFDYLNFLSDMGERPGSKYSIDRIDVDGNYEPSNCRWATSIEQANNRTSNRRIELNGVSMTISEWARHLGIPRSLIANRVHGGWTDEKALTTPRLR